MARISSHLKSMGIFFFFNTRPKLGNPHPEASISPPLVWLSRHCKKRRCGRPPLSPLLHRRPPSPLVYRRATDTKGKQRNEEEKKTMTMVMLMHVNGDGDHNSRFSLSLALETKSQR
ncbi:hypothetical protein L1049_020038 [Liquidambar formosana]|uniref:Uncharacterized protein n=1 Tax=Liquidambar formosana TaxID=63359 RepID=A0AAP0S6K5_LIQFO